jgi:hypothetical protein
MRVCRVETRRIGGFLVHESVDGLVGDWLGPARIRRRSRLAAWLRWLRGCRGCVVRFKLCRARSERGVFRGVRFETPGSFPPPSPSHPLVPLTPICQLHLASCQHDHRPRQPMVWRESTCLPRRLHALALAAMNRPQAFPLKVARSQDDETL